MGLLDFLSVGRACCLPVFGFQAELYRSSHPFAYLPSPSFVFPSWGWVQFPLLWVARGVISCAPLGPPFAGPRSTLPRGPIASLLVLGLGVEGVCSPLLPGAASGQVGSGSPLCTCRAEVRWLSLAIIGLGHLARSCWGVPGIVPRARRSCASWLGWVWVSSPLVALGF